MKSEKVKRACANTFGNVGHAAAEPTVEGVESDLIQPLLPGNVFKFYLKLILIIVCCFVS